MEEFKGAPNTNNEARKKLIKSLGEKSSITDEELILKYGNPPEAEVNEVIKSLEWQEPDKEHAQRMDQIDRFLFYADQQIREWQKAVDNMLKVEEGSLDKQKLLLYNEMLKNEKMIKDKWADFAKDSNEMHKRIYEDISRTMKRLINELATSLKKSK
jgi:hypothetical protein